MVAKPFLVVVHDVAPVFSIEVRAIVQKLEAMLGNRISAAVVPRWHGGPSGAANHEYRDLLDAFGECLLHGWTHQREHGSGFVSWLTRRADEFRGLDAATIRQRVTSAQNDFATLLGREAYGFLPPAWHLPIPATQLDCVRFVLRFHSLDSCTQAHEVRRLATWSWDWGRFGWLAHCGLTIARLRAWTDPSSTPCIAIHPIDVRRGWFTNSLRVIDRLMEQGHVPVLCTDLLPVQGTRS